MALLYGILISAILIIGILLVAPIITISVTVGAMFSSLKMFLEICSFITVSIIIIIKNSKKEEYSTLKELFLKVYLQLIALFGIICILEAIFVGFVPMFIFGFIIGIPIVAFAYTIYVFIIISIIRFINRIIIKRKAKKQSV